MGVEWPMLHVILVQCTLTTQLELQGTFVECVGSAPVAAQLAACVLELVRSPGVQGHQEPYVRRSALLASAQVSPATACDAWVQQIYGSILSRSET